MKKTLHVMASDMPHHNKRLIEFLVENFSLESSSNEVLCCSKGQFIKSEKITYLDKQLQVAHYLISRSKKYDEVVLHGLFNPFLILFIFTKMISLKNISWVGMGGDLVYLPYNYTWKHRLYNWMGNKVKSKISKFYGLAGDRSLFLDKFNSNAQTLPLFFPFKLNKLAECNVASKSSYNFLIGNSGEYTNRHLDALKKIIGSGFLGSVTVNLSYSTEPSYDQSLKELLTQSYPDVSVLANQMPYEDYIKFLDGFDYLVVNHLRQEGVGTLLLFLSLGKKVLFLENVSTVETFIKDGVSEHLPSDDLAHLGFVFGGIKSNKLSDLSLLESYFSDYFS